MNNIYKYLTTSIPLGTWNTGKQAGRRLCTMPALLGVLLCAAGLLAVPGKALAQAPKPYPAGIIWLPNADTVGKRIGDLSRFVEWQYPFVDGIRLRTGWNVVQPQSNSYDWSIIDQALSLAAQNGKRVGVSIASGIATPQWVYDNGATKYRLLDGSGNSMPIPWEPAYYDQWLTFVRTFGARYDSNPALGGKTQYRQYFGQHYMGQDYIPIHFGLGQATNVGSLTIHWPSGTRQTLQNIAANQTFTVVEPRH